MEEPRSDMILQEQEIIFSRNQNRFKEKEPIIVKYFEFNLIFRVQNHHANMKQLVYPSHTPSAYHPGKVNIYVGGVVA